MKKKVVTKKEFLGEYEALRNAFAKINIREAVAPIVRGKIVEDVDTYNKVQQLLDTPDMEHAHKFLLDIDFDEITPETKQKVDDLYQLAISQGYIANDEDFDDDEKEDEEVYAQPEVSDNSGGFEDAELPDSSDATKKDSIGVNAPVLNTPAYTVFYSAMKDGEIRSGECYSNATTVENAKLDATQKLQKLGFTAIEILASEMVDPSSRGSFDTVSDFGAPINKEEKDDKEAIVDEAEDSETENKEEEDKEEKTEKEDKEEKETETDDEEKELSRSDKLNYFKQYLEEFKSLLKKMKAETYIDMPLSDRAKFYDRMSKIWADKPDPSEFMSDDNVKQIEHMRIKLD